MEATRSSLRLVPGTRNLGGTSSLSLCRRGGARTFASLVSKADTVPKKKQRVVILGSGWAGYALARTLDPAKFERVVVSPRSHFVFTPLLASTAVGTLEFRAVMEPVRRTGAGFHEGWADDIDFGRKTVRVEANVDDDAAARTRLPDPAATAASGKEVKTKKGPMIEVPYDKLVVAVGAYSQTFGIRGVREHAHFLRDVGDARRIRQRVLALFERCATPGLGDDARRELLHFAVVGGGPTGIEFAAELHDLVHDDLARIYPALVPLVRVTVFDVAPTVLPMFDKELKAYAMELFARRGIEVRTQHHLEGIREAGAGEVGEGLGVLKLQVKECMPAEKGVGLVVWSTGLMQNPLVQRLVSKEFRLPPAAAAAATPMGENGDGQGGPDQATPRPADGALAQLQSDPKTGSIITDGHLRALLAQGDKAADQQHKVLDDVFVIGDCAVVENNRSLPKTAQVASQQAVYLARRLNRDRSLDDEKPFVFRNWGVMTYLGGWRAIHQSSADELKGWAAWVLWRTAYLTKSMSIRNKMVVPFYWFISWLFGRDISRF